MDLAFIQWDGARGCAGVCHICDTNRAPIEQPRSPHIDLNACCMYRLKTRRNKNPKPVLSVRALACYQHICSGNQLGKDSQSKLKCFRGEISSTPSLKHSLCSANVSVLCQAWKPDKRPGDSRELSEQSVIRNGLPVVPFLNGNVAVSQLLSRSSGT